MVFPLWEEINSHIMISFTKYTKTQAKIFKKIYIIQKGLGLGLLL